VASRAPSNKLIFKLQSIFEARDVVYSNSRDVF
jgi:hypothetical protein